MEHNKKLTIKRLVIFLVIACLPLCVITPILNAYYGEMFFVSENAAAATFAFGALGMFAPAVANLLTRIITKEGLGRSYLGLTAGKKLGWYIASVAVKLGELALSTLLICVVFLNGMSFGEIFSSEYVDTNVPALVFQVAYSVIIFFPAFGEEWGWRGYMMPKLIDLMGKPAAVVVGGVIWGLWHAPLTISGHNFGTDYAFYPWLGILLMCVLCVVENAFLTLLTERTNSIYPASFAHMVGNNVSVSLLFMVFGSEAAMMKLDNVGTIQIFLTLLVSVTVTGVVSFILLLKGKQPEKAQ